MSWSSLPEALVERFVATVALEVMRVAPEERSEVNADNGTITLVDRGLRLDLRPLAERCSALPQSEWLELIEEAVAAWLAPAPSLPARFEDAASLLRVQLVNAADPDTFSRQLAKGLVAELGIDRGGRAGLTRQGAASWGRPEGELWEVALGNIGTEGAVVDSFVLDEPVELEFFHVRGEGAYIASLALRLPDLGESLPRYGWLFMVPHRHSLWFAPLADLSQCAAGMLMLERAVEELREGQIPISANIYWTNGNRFEAISIAGLETGFDLTDAITAVVRTGNAS